MNRRPFLAAIITGTTAFAGCLTDDRRSTGPKSDEKYQEDDPTAYNQPEQYDEVKSLTVENGLETDLNATITIRNGDGTILSETNVSAPKGGHPDKQIPVADESGDYTAEITVDGRGTVTTSFDLRTPVSDPVLYIGEIVPDEGEPFGAAVDGAPAV